MMSNVNIHDLYFFQKRLYFSFYSDDVLTYVRAETLSIPELTLSLLMGHQKIDLRLLTNNNHILMSRGKYYDEVKREIKAYCNYEKVSRIFG